MLRSSTLRALLLGVFVIGGCSTSDENSAAVGTGGQTPPTGTGGTTNAVGTGGTVLPPAPVNGTGGTTVSGTGGAPNGTGGGSTIAATGGRGPGGPSTGGAPPSGGRGPGAGGAVPPGGIAGSSGIDPGTTGDGDFTVGPNYTASPDGRAKAGAPAGFSASFTLTSAQSKIFKGDDFTPPLTFSRSIKVWIPSQYVDGQESPFMVSSDGFYGGLQGVVQNMADDPNPDHHVPPLTIIGIQNGPNVNPNSERSLEYDTVSDRYWKFVTTEVIPAVLANAAVKAKFPNFKLTSDPNGRGGYGCSSGGPAVMGLAWFGDFNRVFSFSGSFVAIQKTTEHPDGAWEYAKLITDAPFRPDLRIFLEVGQNDNGSTTTEESHRNWVISNRNIAAALKAKGNHYRFMFAQGAGHCDDNARNQVMPEGLVWLWRGYKPKQQQ